jgi:hypothetical protein
MKLFVRLDGLDRSVTKEDRISLLQSIFAEYVELTEDNIVIISDKEYGGYRNFMFVTISDDAQAQQAITDLDNTTTDEGYGMNLNEAKPLEDRPRTGGGARTGGYSNNRAPRTGGYSNNAGGSSRGGYSSNRGNDRGGYSSERRSNDRY